MHCIINLRPVAGCRRIDRQAQVLDEDLGEKVRVYQPNYLEHILRTPNRIPRKLFDCRPEGRRERSAIKDLEGLIRLTRRSKQVTRPKPCSG
jgi:hypothetical protein